MYSGFFRRLFAYAIDAIVLIAIYAILGFLLSLQFIFTPISTLPMIGFWFYGGLFFTTWLYFAGFESSSRCATIGMQILQIKIVDYSGKRISFLRATLRHFACLFLRIGVFFIFFTKKKQALHDKIAKAVVVRHFS